MPFDIRQLEEWSDAAALSRGVESGIEELAAKYGENAFRLRKGTPGVKRLCEEAYPLAQFLSCCRDVQGWEGRLEANYAKADAYIRPNADSPIPIQIVAAVDGYSEHLMDLELNKGKMAVWGQYSKDPKTGVIRKPRLLNSSDGRRRHHERLIVDRIQAKSRKPYDANTWLLISVEEDTRRLRALPGPGSEASKVANEAMFPRVYLIGRRQDGDVLRLK